MRYTYAAALFLLLLSGCAGVRVKKNPTDCDKGIRYYRPKPYLLITPTSETVAITNEGGDTTATSSAGDRFVEIKMEYLPDFSEEYAIQVKPGIGSANVTIGLDDGWNLTSINQTLDSNFDENLAAITGLIGAVKPTVGLSDGRPENQKGAGNTPTHNRHWVVQATNIPLGYYEAVIGRDDCGKKQMYGWRYIGFSPYSKCPKQVCGSKFNHCDEVDVFGLGFENGVMTFRRLNEMGYGPKPAIKNHVPTNEPFTQSSEPSRTKLIGDIADRAIFLAKDIGVGLVKDAKATIDTSPTRQATPKLAKVKVTLLFHTDDRPEAHVLTNAFSKDTEMLAKVKSLANHYHSITGESIETTLVEGVVSEVLPLPASR